MAGGMFSGRGPTLAERSRRSGIGTIGRPRRHCWVTGPDEDPGPHPGLVLEWEHAEHGWRAMVVYVIGAAAVQEWVGTDRLKPADGPTIGA